MLLTLYFFLFKNKMKDIIFGTLFGIFFLMYLKVMNIMEQSIMSNDVFFDKLRNLIFYDGLDNIYNIFHTKFFFFFVLFFPLIVCIFYLFLFLFNRFYFNNYKSFLNSKELLVFFGFIYFFFFILLLEDFIFYTEMQKIFILFPRTN